MFAEIYICEILLFTIMKIYVRQIKYLEMNIPTRFKGDKLFYILIGGEVWLHKEKQIK